MTARDELDRAWELFFELAPDPSPPNYYRSEWVAHPGDVWSAARQVEFLTGVSLRDLVNDSDNRDDAEYKAIYYGGHSWEKAENYRLRHAQLIPLIDNLRNRRRVGLS